MAITMNSSQVQQNFGAALDRVLRGEDVIIERYGMPRAAIVDYDRYRMLVGATQEATRPTQLREAAVAYRAEMTDTSVAPTAAAYRYITRAPDILGGQPIIRGTRVPVRAIAGYHKLGMSMDEILAALPHLTPAQVYEALSYYYDHVDEIEQEIQDNQLTSLIERYGLQVTADGRITFAG